ncbi:unnamed protein product [Rodentolepis nana]|uniref:UEV domain-containing protein n=1 Tax=Rodentolepis nana TaxID=102285 RepID=A0A0R3T6J5_RODNA|nr:unnamed protein product [Rodentolepis nana]
MLSQIVSRLNPQRLRMGKMGVSPKEGSNYTSIKNRFPKVKPTHGNTNFAGNKASKYERQQHESRNNSGASESVNSEKISSINEDIWMHIKNGQDNDVSSMTTSNAAGNEHSVAVHSVKGHNIKMQRTERGKNTLERIINIKKRFPKFRSPFRIRPDISNIATSKEGCRNEKVTDIGDQKAIYSSTIDKKLLSDRVVKCCDFMPTSALSNSSNEVNLRKTVAAPTKELNIRNIKPAIKYKMPNQESVIACGDSKTENTCIKNRPRFNVHATTHEEFITRQMGKQNTSDFSSAQTTTLKSMPKLGFIERKADGMAYTSYVAMLNTESDTLANIRRITARRFWGLEQQFNCKITISNKPLKLRARTVYKLEIEGPTFSEYRHRDAAKSDIEKALQAFHSLRIKIQDYTSDNGQTSRLLCLDGTIPVVYEGNTYNIPLAVYFIHQHPYYPPIAFVRPTPNMQIKPSQNVDTSGKIFLPYLTDWKYPGSSTQKLLEILQGVFGARTPVFSKPKVAMNPPISYGFNPQISGKRSSIYLVSFFFILKHAILPYAFSAATSSTTNGNVFGVPGAGWGAMPRLPISSNSSTPNSTSQAPYFGATAMPSIPSATSSTYLGNATSSTGSKSPLQCTYTGNIRLNLDLMSEEEQLLMSLRSAVVDRLNKEYRELSEDLNCEIQSLQATESDLLQRGNKIETIHAKMASELVFLKLIVNCYH